MSKKQSLLLTLTTLLITLVLLDGYGIYLLKQHGVFIRMVPVADLSVIRPSYHNEEEIGTLGKIFKGDACDLLEQVMNTVPKIEPYSSSDALDIYRHASAGGGTLCGGMSLLYTEALQANGIESRRVQLLRSVFDIYDTHVTVEIWQNGKWVIYDPTFNVSFRKNGQLIGAQEIKQALYDGSFYQIEPVFYGEVRYPARLDTYYMHWLSLYNNVFIPDCPTSRNLLTKLFSKLPPFRYWFGCKFYFEPVSSKYFHQQFQNSLYFGVVVVLPTGIYILGMGIIMVLMLIAKEKRRRE